MALKNSIAALNKALLAKDTNTLKSLLHQKLTYGHSNGWIQSKQDMVNDFTSGKIVYHKIDATKSSIVFDNNVASNREEADVEGVVNGVAFKMKLHVLQVWVWRKKQWLLLSRQSVKISS